MGRGGGCKGKRISLTLGVCEVKRYHSRNALPGFPFDVDAPSGPGLAFRSLALKKKKKNRGVLRFVRPTKLSRGGKP